MPNERDVTAAIDDVDFASLAAGLEKHVETPISARTAVEDDSIAPLTRPNANVCREGADAAGVKM